MLTAQVTRHGTLHFGMQYGRSDDRQLALNILHWLAGILD